MRTLSSIKELDFSKEDGLVPAIIQDAQTGKVLMLGYMNEEALEKTLATKKVTFFSRSKNRLWTKGETSENYLRLVSISPDCDQDALLVKVNPEGPTCHTGTDTCWQEENKNDLQFLGYLTDVIKERRQLPTDESYVARLFSKGINKVAQKVGEEAVEVVIEAKDNDDKLFLDESADLLFHYMMLLEAKGFSLSDVVSILKERHK
ncbi:bifunctional phosphoribosyl-AMP cyclohydrolase/phosphoribosyl-ATP diphosphatase HisIE [Roseivirga pacifica]|uniref:bifunctional phosphoribosyl-AMP cyclohydrolase/phosphoribosyl-ATP diphosphatase HisIE n=1 Tax=Roseivirga pacifica TaxID=1267423 RepID=UPI00209658F0|nr:bifunctional phosphoribosyl-AMP cyclohydrolase/phosphoribosyl-ATP diphosphatase HisIE [Roseivirga pacifica]MCO6358086.1 bifunctional phosphoribosyl-AMP cyclohydrolase/phosphoribosyl-ATP diphosphatase HisIE [Roseivirga pacifica]MCO6366524.1 bifunctional phosphoribosyl-AMP cyclohydrolase/phosphoribosyl-ATP diphosphatase HisIE [Roseivirga pacifica]MCO6371009.1 bifunctional phosphoribosyl-AMP cyclohydrolase/phosphoribosyl-ATP diphosphatase HisIE [Roseivirga pacifica]MCO6373817.1 bifunctional pho